MGVQGYFVQLKSKETDSIIFEKRVDATSVDIELPPGKYLQRVGVINKFHKVSSFTEWKDFSLIKKVTPVITDVKNGDIKIDEGTKLVSIFGEKFLKGSKVKLLKPGSGNDIDVKPDYQSETMIQFKVDPAIVPEGSYHVMVENPGGAKAQKENSVALYRKKPPREFGKDEKALAEMEKKDFRWYDLIIGVPRIRKGNVFIGSGEIAVFTGLLAGSAAETAAADKVAKSTASNLNYQLFNNFILYNYFLRPNLTNSSLLFNLGLKNYLDTNVAKEKYLWHKKNAMNFAGAAAVVYLFHLADAFGWIDISFGLAGSSAASYQPASWETAFAQNSSYMTGPEWELRLSFPIH